MSSQAWKAHRRAAQDVALSYLMKIVLPLLRRLPSRIAFRLGRLLGRIAFWTGTRDRRRAIVQIRRALEVESDIEVHRLAEEVFMRIGEGIATLMQQPYRDAGLEKTVRVEGLEHLDVALSKGKGAIWLTGHIGNWELLAIRIAGLGYPLRVVARRLHYVRLDRMLDSFRRRFGVIALMRGEQTHHEALKQQLASGRLLGILVDQNTRCRGAMLPFFGRQAFTPISPALLAIDSGAPMLVCFVRRTGPDRHVARLLPPLDLPPASSRESQARLLMTRVNEQIEDAIRTDPASWPWFHPRWQTRAEGDADG